MARCLAVVLAVALGTVACAEEEPAFDPGIVLDVVQAEVEPIGIAAVACDGLDDETVTTSLPELGGDLVCRGTLNGDSVDLAVAVAPAVDSELSVIAEIVTSLFDVAAVETAAAARLDADLGGSPEVDCVERLVVVTPGRQIECRVTAEGGTAGPVDQPLIIEILDADANWDVNLVP